MSETVETKLARLETKLDAVLDRLKSGDEHFKEFEKRIGALERQFYTAATIATLAWAAFLAWWRMKGF